MFSSGTYLKAEHVVISNISLFATIQNYFFYKYDFESIMSDKMCLGKARPHDFRLCRPVCKLYTINKIYIIVKVAVFIQYL